jgi:hypothetical protein
MKLGSVTVPNWSQDLAVPVAKPTTHRVKTAALIRVYN